jgi:SAM-dependent methyltransferase
VRRPVAAVRRFAGRVVRAVFPRDARRHFTTIHRRNLFAGDESLSGKGASLVQTATIRHEIPRLLRALGARSLLDAPCGDFHWMRHVDLGGLHYTGVDIVEALIADNRAHFAAAGREFLCRDLARDPLPAADVVLCRDCLVHLTFHEARRILLNFRHSGSRYLLATTFPDRSRNTDLVWREIWRPLNLERPPFNLPGPLRLINENCTEDGGAYADKCLGLWRLDDPAFGHR